MFDIGFLEIAIILVLSLLVLGPERLPKAARTIGYWFGKARRYVEGMKSQVESEFDSTELKRVLHNQEVQIKELQNKLHNNADFVDTEYHNQFSNTDDPGTDEAADVNSEASQLKEEKPASSPFEMIEETDERWDELEASNRSDNTGTQQDSSDTKSAESENVSNKNEAADKAQ